MTQLETAAVAGLACLVAGLLVPRLIARIPEPEPKELPAEADSEILDAEGPKELYAHIAALPGLTWKAALATGLCGALIGGSLGWAWPLVFLLPLVPVSVALAVVDARTRLLPTFLIAPSYVVTISLVLVSWVATRDTDDLVRAGWGWLIAGGIFFVLWFIYPPGLGYGDVRLSGVLGIVLGYLGWAQLTIGIYSGFLIFGLPGLLLAIVRRDRKLLKSAFPFGPFMLIGALIAIVVGEWLAAHLVAG